MHIPLKVTYPFKWKKAKASNSQGNCVEVSELPHGFKAVRDSKDPDGPVLIFSPGEWDAFIGGVKAGEFD